MGGPWTVSATITNFISLIKHCPNLDVDYLFANRINIPANDDCLEAIAQNRPQSTKIVIDCDETTGKGWAALAAGCPKVSSVTLVNFEDEKLDELIPSLAILTELTDLFVEVIYLKH